MRLQTTHALAPFDLRGSTRPALEADGVRTIVAGNEGAIFEGKSLVYSTNMNAADAMVEHVVPQTKA